MHPPVTDAQLRDWRAHPPFTDAQLRELAASYAGGASIRALVTETGWAYGTVQRRLHIAVERGFLPAVRPKGGARVDPSASS